MTIYLGVFVAVILLGANFAATKKYQSANDTSVPDGMFFNVITSIFSIILFFTLNSFRLSFNTYTILMAFLMGILNAIYVIIGFIIMRKSSLALYTVFLLTGGMTLPYVWGLFFLDEYFSFLRCIGLIIIILSVYITNKDKSKTDPKQLFLCVLVFTLNGIISIISKQHQINAHTSSAADFVIWSNIAKVVFCGIALMFVKKDYVDIHKNAKSYLLMLLSSLFGGISYFLQLEFASKLPATLLYPILTGGSVIITAVFERLFFRTKLKRNIIIGVAMCFFGTCMFL